MNAVAEIPLASGLRRLVDLWIDEVRLGVRRFWRGGEFSNAPAGEATSLLNRMMRLLRFTFVLLAVHLDLPPLRGRAPLNAQKRAGPKVWSPKRPAFPLFARYRIAYDDTPRRPQPSAFVRAAKAGRDRMRTVQRKLDALARALADPMPFIRRMARRLPARLMVFGWRPPRRPPRGARHREFNELCSDAHREATFQLGLWRRRRRNIEAAASGS